MWGKGMPQWFEVRYVLRVTLEVFGWPKVQSASLYVWDSAKVGREGRDHNLVAGVAGGSAAPTVEPLLTGHSEIRTP